MTQRVYVTIILFVIVITYVNESLNISAVEFVIHLLLNHPHSIYMLKSSDNFSH